MNALFEARAGWVALESTMVRSVRPFLVIVLMLALIDGAVYNLLPVTFPVFRQAFGAGLEMLGGIQLIFFLSTLLFSVIGGWFLSSCGIRRSVLSLVLGLAIGFILIALSRRVSLLLGGVLCFGLTLSGIEVVSNVVISDYFGEKRQRFFFIWGLLNSVGAVSGPVVFGTSLQYSRASPLGWRLLYVVLAGVMLLVTVAAGVVLRPEHSGHPGLPEARVDSFPTLAVVMKQPAMYGISVLIFLHGVAQVGMVSWAGQLYIRRFAIGPAMAAYLISANSLGFLVGRSLLGWITGRWRISELVILGACGFGGTLAFVATIAAPGYIAGLIAFASAGLFISGDGPSIYSFVGSRFVAQSATAFSILNGIGNIGSAVGPYSVGVIGGRFGIETGIWFLPLFSFALSIMSFVWFALKRVRKELPSVLDVMP